MTMAVWSTWARLCIGVTHTAVQKGQAQIGGTLAFGVLLQVEARLAALL